MTYHEAPDPRTGKAPRHQEAALEVVQVSNAEVKQNPSWYAKPVQEMNDVELNNFYKATMKKTSLEEFDGKIYIMEEVIGFPQFNVTTPEMEYSMWELADRYLLLAKEAGYLVKKKGIWNNKALYIKLYRRDTDKSNIAKLPQINYSAMASLVKL